jgi:hypothetical protein
MKIFGQEVSVLNNQISALVLNLWAWFLSLFGGRSAANSSGAASSNKQCPQKSCIIIRAPGGLEKLEVAPLSSSASGGQLEQVTVGYNVTKFKGPLVNLDEATKDLGDLVVVKIHYFSVNYADVCIRWGLYESALRYVGWPIIPGFDFSGEVEIAGPQANFHKGDKVVGFTLFGAYSTRLLVPASQIRVIPKGPKGNPFTMTQAAAFPAVAATALHAVRRARQAALQRFIGDDMFALLV